MSTLTTSERSVYIPDSWTGGRWTRLECSTRSDTLEDGLQARLADPLWMLHRQWQFGEFKGEDAASPVGVALGYGATKVSSYFHLAGATGRVESAGMPRGVPLETVVERQTVTGGPAAWKLSAEAGLKALRYLDEYGAGAHRGLVRNGLPLETLPDHPLLQKSDQRRASILRRTALDGRRLSQMVRTLGGAQTARNLEVPGTDQAKVAAALDAWLVAYEDRISEPGDHKPAWKPERMEHSFQISAHTGTGRVTLKSEEYPGGHLDWWAFDVADKSTHARIAKGSPTQVTGTVHTIPTPVRYHGMPADRFWEREEGQVWFGGLQGGPTDLARLVVGEFATIHSDDWFLVPLGVEVGSLARVTRLDVTDTFGRTKEVRSSASIDGANRRWKMFELDGDKGPQSAEGAPWVFVAPTLASIDEGRVAERVRFARDEGANLAWAIEALVENPLGRAVERRPAWLEKAQAALAASDAPAPQSRDDLWRWILQTKAPPHWVPLLPVRIESSSETNLRRGRMQQWEDYPPEVGAGPLSDVLEKDRVLRIREEELPRAGVVVTRQWQLARWLDGSLHLWMGRRKRVGRGGRSSGLRFDIIDRSGE